MDRRGLPVLLAVSMRPLRRLLVLQGAVGGPRRLQLPLTNRRAGFGAAAAARHGQGRRSSNKKAPAPAHAHNTAPRACERRTPWPPASAAVERPRCTSPQGCHCPQPHALFAQHSTVAAMAAGTLPAVHMAAVEGGTGQRLGHAVIIVAGVCSLVASLTTFV